MFSKGLFLMGVNRGNCMVKSSPFSKQSCVFTTLRKSLLKTLQERDKMLYQAISPFATMFTTLSKKKKLHHLGNIQFVICNCFQFEHSIFDINLDSDLTLILNPLPDNKILDWSKLKHDI